MAVSSDSAQKVIVQVELDAADAAKRAHDFTAEIDKVVEANKKLVDQGKRTSASYVENKIELSALQREQKAYITISSQAEGSNNKLRGSLAILTSQYNAFGKEERTNTLAGKALEIQTRAISDELSKNEKKIGDSRRGVGSYTEAIIAARGGQQSLAESVKSTVTGFGFFPTALSGVTGPITGFINQQRNVIQGFQAIKQLQVDATVATAESVIANEVATAAEAELAASKIAEANATAAATAATEAAALALTAATAGIITAAEAATAAAIAAEAAAAASAALTASKTAEAEAAVAATAATEAQTTATVLSGEATKATAESTGLLKLALASTGIGLFILALGTLVSYFNSTNEGAKKIKVIFADIGAVVQESLKTLGSYGKVIFDLISGNFSKISEDFNKANDNLFNIIGNSAAAAKAAGAITVERQKLTKAEREYSEEKVKQRGEVDLLTKKLRDQNIPEAERLKISQKAKDLRETIFQNDLKFAQQNEKLVEKEQTLNSKKDFQAITDAKNRVQEVINAKNNEVQGIENRESRLTKTQEREIARREAAEQKRADAIGRINEDRAKSELSTAANILTVREKEFAEINLDINKRETLYRKYGQSTEQLEKERIARAGELARKFNEEDLKQIQANVNAAAKIRIGLIKDPDQRQAAQNNQQNNESLQAVDNQILAVAARMALGEKGLTKLLQSAVDERKAITDKADQDRVDQQQAVEERLNKAEAQGRADAYQAELDALNFEQQQHAERLNMNETLAKSYGDLAGTISGFAGKNTALGKIAFLAQQGFAIAEILINSERAKAAIVAKYALLELNAAAIPFAGPLLVAGLEAAKYAELGIATTQEVVGIAKIGAAAVLGVAGKAKGGIQGLDYSSDGKGTVLPGYAKNDNLNAYLRSGETVIVSEAAQNPAIRRILSIINESYGGRSLDGGSNSNGHYASGGTFSSREVAMQINQDYLSKTEAAGLINAAISNLNIVVGVKDIISETAKTVKVQNDANF